MVGFGLPKMGKPPGKCGPVKHKWEDSRDYFVSFLRNRYVVGVVSAVACALCDATAPQPNVVRGSVLAGSVSTFFKVQRVRWTEKYTRSVL